jgi:hypothetical protein
MNELDKNENLKNNVETPEALEDELAKESKEKVVGDASADSLEVKVKSNEESVNNDYFVYLNRLITTVLTSLIMFGLVLGSFVGTEAIFGSEALANFSIKAVVVFSLFSSLSLFVGQSLQNYFVKIIEKESYKFVLGKTFKNFVWQVLLVAGLLPALLYAISLGGEYVFLVATMYVVASSLMGISIREAEHANRLQASLFGMFLGTAFWSLFVFSLFNSAADIWGFAFIAILPISALVSEIILIVADMVGVYIKD